MNPTSAVRLDVQAPQAANVAAAAKPQTISQTPPNVDLKALSAKV
jgi:hypothetical protein